MIHEFLSSSLTISKLLELTELSPSSYYYKPKQGIRGRKPTTETLHTDRGKISNGEVIEEIIKFKANKYETGPYPTVTKNLHRLGYIINKKKVYRLMKTKNLLSPRMIKTYGNRDFIDNYKAQATKPLTYFSMDIKYIYVPQERKSSYVLTVIDIYTRMAVKYIFKRSIRQEHVIEMWQEIKEILPEGEQITVRNDNGSQFIATSVRQMFKEMGIKQEFTHVATPQQNGFIESFHSIMQKSLFDRNTHYTFAEIQQDLEEYNQYYNFERLNPKLKYLTAYEFYLNYISTNGEKNKLVHLAKKYLSDTKTKEQKTINKSTAIMSVQII